MFFSFIFYFSLRHQSQIFLFNFIVTSTLIKATLTTAATADRSNAGMKKSCIASEEPARKYYLNGNLSQISP